MPSSLNRKRGSSVSFTRAKDDNGETGDEIHISLAPYVQTYLAHSGQGLGCCGITLPVPFERAAPHSWWNPKFDSDILEEQFKQSAFPQTRLRFRYALTYILLVSVSWLVYFTVIGIEHETATWPIIASVFSGVGIIVSVILYLTHTDYYKRFALPISLCVAAVICFLSLLFLSVVPPFVDGLTLVGHYTLCTEVLLLIYTVLPMPLYACVGISSIYSIAFEFLTAYLYGSKNARQRFFGGYFFFIHNQYTQENVTNDYEMDERKSTSAFDISRLSNVISSMRNNGTTNVESSGYYGDSLPARTTITETTQSRTSLLLSVLGLNTLNNENISNSYDVPGTSSYDNIADKLNSSISSTINNMTKRSTIMSAYSTMYEKTNNVSSSFSELFNLIRKNGEGVNYFPSNSNETYSLRDDGFSSTIFIRILMQICIHLIGVHILIMTFVRMRGTFMKVGQSLLVRRQLEMEKQLKEKMIHSVMPPKVADWLMEESEREREREDSLKKRSIPSNNTDLRSLFRPFNMHSMENVSILFADIVGFTKMSSNKTAEELVGVLNDLFERFDDLCEQHGCEKISTLGDCYYCVSGCPEPRSDHAKCCVEMGLAMIEAIKQFDIERREGVNMRVGVHTGTVLCGIVGTKRFKFDVWSNDVTLANKLESTGKPGRVHLSENTLSFLDDQYIMEESETICGIKTFFVKARKSDLVKKFTANCQSPRSISPVMETRHRLASYNIQQKSKLHYLHMVTNTSNYKAKANSLPSILDLENDEDVLNEREITNKSPISVGNYEKRKAFPKSSKHLQRQRTIEEMTTLRKESVRAEKSEKCPSQNASYIDRSGFNQDSTKNDVEMDPNPLPSSPLLYGHEANSCASSICSRKDSGIRSNSRRSSIQQQLFLMNGIAQGDLLTHRVSGYYTSNSTLNLGQDVASLRPLYPFPPIVTDTFGACFHKLRKHSDLQLIKCVQDNVSSQRSYFVKPPLSRVTLFFKNKDMEKEYRENAHKINECSSGNPPTLATSRFNTYFDVLISALVYTAVSISLFLLCEPTVYYLIFFGIATAIQITAVTLCVRQLLYPSSTQAIWRQKIFQFFSKWYPWHICGAVLVGLPITSIFLNFSCNNARILNNFEYHYGYLIFVALVHFCNFTQLNCWMKNLLVTVSGVLFLCLTANRVSEERAIRNVTIENQDGNSYTLSSLNKSWNDSNSEESVDSLLQYISNSVMRVQQEAEIKYNERLYGFEIFLDMILLLLLVWFLNREFEISYRLSFHGNAVAARDKARVQSMKNQADWLLHNIIPKYVADQLKTTAKYSQNHKSVGIIFASIVNFNELYDESYLGGKEYLRVLNELIGDFDELLEKPEYANVEKIKTIGSTFMAASGLNPQVREQNDHEYTHLYQLVDFAIAMYKVIYNFNRDLLGFKLILRIGFNYGDVTAGVIGATKLYYDIWGDAVNIASRMDSTGVAGRIQIASNSLDVLSERYDFEPRGQVYVKGKDNMDVFLLSGKKNDSRKENGSSNA